uniref:Uncharacterized protein n=1 Tax=Knipowitschia caucasica TaxID=637954 RepID=A0AAV2JJN8_KNICA
MCLTPRIDSPCSVAGYMRLAAALYPLRLLMKLGARARPGPLQRTHSPGEPRAVEGDRPNPYSPAIMSQKEGGHSSRGQSNASLKVRALESIERRAAAAGDVFVRSVDTNADEG